MERTNGIIRWRYFPVGYLLAPNQNEDEVKKNILIIETYSTVHPHPIFLTENVMSLEIFKSNTIKNFSIYQQKKN